MRGLLGFICLLLVGVIAGMALYVGDNEIHYRRATQLQRIEELNLQVRAAQEYSQLAVEATRMLAVENGLLVEREQKITMAYTLIEEENRALKRSLAEAVDTLEEQVEQINELIESNESLSWQVEVLQKAMDAVSAQKKQEIIKDVGDTILDDINDLGNSLSFLTIIVPALL